VPQLEECLVVALAVRKTPQRGQQREMVGQQVPPPGKVVSGEWSPNGYDLLLDFLLTTRDLGADDLGSPLDEESLPKDKGARG
jgi:hypothetical protein